MLFFNFENAMKHSVATRKKGVKSPGRKPYQVSAKTVCRSKL